MFSLNMAVIRRDISLLTELGRWVGCRSYKHSAPTELSLDLMRPDIDSVGELEGAPFGDGTAPRFTHPRDPMEHQSDYTGSARSSVTSPARTIRISPSSVSTRSAPSLASPRVVPSRTSCPLATRIRFPLA